MFHVEHLEQSMAGPEMQSARSKKVRHILSVAKDFRIAENAKVPLLERGIFIAGGTA